MSGIRWILTCAGCYALYCLLLFLLQRHLIFPSLFVGLPDDPSLPEFVERLWVSVPGAKVEGWFLPSDISKESPRPLVIFAHGNGELIDWWPETFRGLNRRGLHVLLLEYPGYGRSLGKPSQKNIARAFCAAHDLMTQRPDVDASRIILFGRSIGGGVACALASQRSSAALILTSTFTSLHPFARRYLAPSFLLRDPFDNKAVVSSYAGPVLIVHGTHDTVVPYAHGKALAQAARHSRFVAYDADHNDCPPDWEAFFDVLVDFLEQTRVL
ncbi:alpha/beta hydrolase [Desulfosoma sp.]|uniref:alpha/beta hydrolase n=1 Tax=Desulfosoma sp. TaxID=2603217 RepID=UPI00404A6336